MPTEIPRLSPREKQLEGGGKVCPELSVSDAGDQGGEAVQEMMEIQIELTELRKVQEELRYMLKFRSINPGREREFTNTNWGENIASCEAAVGIRAGMGAAGVDAVVIEGVEGKGVKRKKRCLDWFTASTEEEVNEVFNLQQKDPAAEVFEKQLL